MRNLLLISITFVFIGAQPGVSIGKYWYENNAVQAQILAIKTVGIHDFLKVRVTDLGPMSIYLAAPVGTHVPASLDPKGLFDSSWRRIGVPSGLRAVCSIKLMAGESVTGTVGTDHRTFPAGQHPSKIEVGVTVYPTLKDCRRATNAFTFYTPPEPY